jgi:hypothetical protein
LIDGQFSVSHFNLQTWPFTIFTVILARNIYYKTPAVNGTLIADRCITCGGYTSGYTGQSMDNVNSADDCQKSCQQGSIKKTSKSAENLLDEF